MRVDIMELAAASLAFALAALAVSAAYGFAMQASCS